MNYTHHNEERMNFDWLSELVKKFPDIPETRKNFIEIAGYPKRENVNSNLLAFYFDEKEEHGFKRLFLDSLLDIYERKLNNESWFKREVFETDFLVAREATTDKKGRIDLVLMEKTEEETVIPSWSIIIENKLFADLYNDLGDYWNSTNSEQKIGIVLSVNSENLTEKEHYVNILHKEFVAKIQSNLSRVYLESDDRHLLFLKEYISNINSYYEDKNEVQKMDKALESFHKHKEEIGKLKEMDVKLLKHVSDKVVNVFEKLGFSSFSATKLSRGKHFYVNEEPNLKNVTLEDNLEIAKSFRFWINLGELRDSGVFIGTFELWDENTTYGDELKKRLEPIKGVKELSIGTGGKSGGNYQHIYYFEKLIEDLSCGLEDRLNALVTELELEKQINKAIEELKNIKTLLSK